jgi:hypothetical protein
LTRFQGRNTLAPCEQWLSVEADCGGSIVRRKSARGFNAELCRTPFNGQGTSLALIGAFVLARELTRMPKDHGSAFARCEARMRPSARKNQDMVLLERREPSPDDVFDDAKNSIVIDDLIDARA